MAETVIKARNNTVAAAVTKLVAKAMVVAVAAAAAVAESTAGSAVHAVHAVRARR